MRRVAIAIATVVVGLLVVLAFVTPANGQANPEANQVEYWCEQGVKIEPVDTPFIVPEPQEGTTWTLLVLKGGTTNEAIPLPVVGQGYSHSEHENSHVILCWEPTTTTTTTSTSTTSTTTTTVPSDSTTTTMVSTTTTDPATTTSSSTSTTDPTTTSTTLVSSTTTSSSTVPPTTSTICYEDMPCWDCKTMGNKVCGPTLPNTGAPLGLLFVIGLGLIVLGGATVAGMRSTKDE